MSSSRSDRIPRPWLDPICSAADALRVFSLQISKPLCSEVLVMFLDDDGFGGTLVTISGASDPTSLVEIAETMATCAAMHPEIAGIVFATVRPGGGPLIDDDEIWTEVELALDDFDLVLIDWFVIGRDGTVSMRDELGLRPIW